MANIADSLNLIVQTERRRGECFVSEVLEIQIYDLPGDRYTFDTIFRRDAFSGTLARGTPIGAALRKATIVGPLRPRNARTRANAEACFGPCPDICSHI